MSTADQMVPFTEAFRQTNTWANFWPSMDAQIWSSEVWWLWHKVTDPWYWCI